MKIFIDTEDWEDSFLEHLPDEEVPTEKTVLVLLDLLGQAQLAIRDERVKMDLLKAKKPIPANK